MNPGILDPTAQLLHLAHMVGPAALAVCILAGLVVIAPRLLWLIQGGAR